MVSPYSLDEAEISRSSIILNNMMKYFSNFFSRYLNFYFSITKIEQIETATTQDFFKHQLFGVVEENKSLNALFPSWYDFFFCQRVETDVTVVQLQVSSVVTAYHRATTSTSKEHFPYRCSRNPHH